MNSLLILGLFGIGIIAGLRSFTVPAVICWATYFGWLDLSESRLALLGKPVVVGIVSLLALGELIADKLPMTPSRISPGPLLARVATAAFSAIAIAIARASVGNCREYCRCAWSRRRSVWWISCTPFPG